MKQEQRSTNSQFQITSVNKFQPCFEENASLFSRFFFLWTQKLISLGAKKHLEMNDLSDLSEREEPTFSHNIFSKIFYGLESTKTKKILRSFWKFIGPTFLLGGFLATIANLLQFSGPIVIGKVLQFLRKGEDVSVGITWVSVLLVCYLIRTIIFQHGMHFVNISCIKVLNSANSLIYHKILGLSGSSKRYLDTGSIMNYINVDVMSFYYFIMMSTFLFSAPFMIIVAIILLIVEVGWIGLVAPVVFLLGMIVQQRLMTSGFEMRKDQLFWADKRSKCVNEYFSGIRIIKYYGWERLISQRIESIRKQQLNLNMKVLMIRTYVEVLMNMLPIISSIIIFAVYAAIQGEQNLTPAKVYTVLSLFNLISVPMRLIVITIIQLMNSTASITRIEHFFGYSDKSFEGFQPNSENLDKGQIVLKDCEFTWQNDIVKKHFEIGKQLSSKTPDKKKEDDKKKNEAQQKKQKKKKKKQSDPNKPKKKNKKGKKKKTADSSLTQPLLNDKGQDLTKPPKHALKISQLKISSGQFIGVVGRVGSGKSTLLYSILGEIDKVSGTVDRKGTIAYIPQVSWLRSATIRDNIIFENQQIDEDRYHQILKICQLEPDLQILGGGDMTEIGQKGVNLSGGQKQRISIARACYADADIYLIDDCLSALDSYVGKNIFHNVIRNYLHNRGKTVVFVTNAIEYTDYCDRIMVMERGQIADQGTPQEMKMMGHSIFGQIKLQIKKSQQAESEKLIKQQEQEEQKKKQAQQDALTLQEQGREQKKKKKQLQALVKVQERMKGSVPWRFYLRFFTGPGGFTAILMFVFILFAQMARIASDWWLGQWSNNMFEIPQNQYIWIYGILSLVVGILMYVKGYFFAKFIIKSSRVIQRRLIETLLHTPLSWFDVTPTGRILARTTKDQDDLDNSLSFNVQYAAQNLFALLSSVILISVATPIYLVVAVISGIIYYFLIGLYMKSSRQIKRLEANTRAPLISHIQQTINGINVIRAFDRTNKFIDKFFMKQKDFIVATVNQNITNRWIGFVTDLFAVVTMGAAGYLGVMSVVISMGSSSSNFIGLALVWSLQINAIMSFTLRVLADTESNMNAVVRLYDYIDNNPSQKSFDEAQPKNQKWPTKGNYKIQKASYRYRPQLPLVLQDLTFDIKDKAKIGVVGRTGSGKSTLTLGLLRILQLSKNDQGQLGKIVLDEQNTSQLGLHCLRHKITIIPQDPTLFTGSIKTNIDPFDNYGDVDIAQCLKKVQLWDQINQNTQQKGQIRKKVYSKVEQSGANFSLGQRQLICMARALIRKPKVLLMDQATASIDEKTDETIQKMIRNVFTETTVITIAHRLNTIIYYDKILVLDKGKVQQYGRPVDLVKDPQSFLGKLIRKTGKTYMQKIIAMAQSNAKPV